MMLLTANASQMPLSIDVITTSVATIISTVVSSFVAFIAAKITLKYQERQNLNDLITKIIEMSLTYPYLEDDDYCLQWGCTQNKDENSMRYDNYCCIIFNLIERLWKHCNGNKKKIDELLYVDEMVKRHLRWWRSEYNNLDGYDKRFQKYINSLIR